MLVTRPTTLRFPMHAGRWLWHICATALAVALVLSALAPPLTSAQEEGEGNGGESAVSVNEARSQMRKRDVNAQVVGGTPVAQGTLTFMTLIFVDVGEGFQNCGGSLITPRHVLTAAHCVEDLAEPHAPFDPSQFTLGIGQVDADGLAEENLFGVVSISKHPGWDRFTFANDVAVLELDEAVSSNLAKPIALIDSGDTSLDNPGRAVTVAGWGLTSGGGEPSHDLLRADLQVVVDAPCDAVHNIVEDVVICAGAPNKSSCNGDSGGALFATVTTKAGGKTNRAKAQNQREVKAEGKKHKKKKGKKKKKGGKTQTTVTQMGVTSFVVIGCPPGMPGGYAQLSAPAIHDFIDEALAS